MSAAAALLWFWSANRTEATPLPSHPSWNRFQEPVFTGQFNVASDPHVFREGATYRMYYTCLDEQGHTEYL